MSDWILFFHILSVIIWMGGSIYVEALMASAGRGGDEAIFSLVRSSALNPEP